MWILKIQKSILNHHPPQENHANHIYDWFLDITISEGNSWNSTYLWFLQNFQKLLFFGWKLRMRKILGIQLINDSYCLVHTPLFSYFKIRSLINQTVRLNCVNFWFVGSRFKLMIFVWADDMYISIVLWAMFSPNLSISLVHLGLFLSIMDTLFLNTTGPTITDQTLDQENSQSPEIPGLKRLFQMRRRSMTLSQSWNSKKSQMQINTVWLSKTAWNPTSPFIPHDVPIKPEKQKSTKLVYQKFQGIRQYNKKYSMWNFGRNFKKFLLKKFVC